MVILQKVLGRMGLNFHHPAAEHIMPLTRSYGRRRGRSSLFPFEDGFLDDAHGDQSLTPGLNSPTRCQNGERMERYSRKVFVGGLPPDIDEDEITNSFRRYGHLVVDWPHKAESKSYFPPKGWGVDESRFGAWLGGEQAGMSASVGLDEDTEQESVQETEVSAYLTRRLVFYLDDHLTSKAKRMNRRLNCNSDF
ncbi:cytoplasmic polyadenylation element-binding protein 3 isoform X1 [Tachysurus ichikawai]